MVRVWQDPPKKEEVRFTISGLTLKDCTRIYSSLPPASRDEDNELLSQLRAVITANYK